MEQDSERPAVGDRRSILEMQRDRLILGFNNADARVVASVSKELRAVCAELDALPSTTKRTALDDLADRRAKRLADAKALARSTGTGD